MPLPSPQIQQNLNLLVLLVLGKYLELVYLSWISLLGVLLCTVIIEHVFLYLKNQKLNFFSFSSLSTGMGIMLMLASTQDYLYVLVIAIGLLQKHFLQYEGRHFYNPSNFALIFALLFFYSDAHIVLGQLGDSLWLTLFVLVLGVSILLRVSRWAIPVAFILSYLLIQFLIIVQSDPVLIMDDIYHRFYSVSFIVFILFMLTDPKTTPKDLIGQAGFAIMLALGATVLDYFYGFRVHHLFISLFILSTVVPLYDVFSAKKPKEKISSQLVFTVISLLFLAVIAVTFIELKPPYYFEMNG